MKAILILLVPMLVTGAAGFFAGQMLVTPAPPADPQIAQPKKQEAPLYKMPLGKFTFQIVRDTDIMHLLFDLDIYIAGTANFEKMNGAQGRATFRDATLTAISDMSQNATWMSIDRIEQLEKDFLAEQIVRKLHLTLPMVVTGRINRFSHSLSLREREFVPGGG